ncbi:Uncharacterized protein FVE85_8290 [Porphyridium purpureum]|uniref:ABC1 atypical kinase-like domain-containing protein n=1 Tax=Porphyridium purpureum TaxID=35688 RepID=A0A5J4YKJ6_PORPP|nr:Uncharacterized protein FVE85_8290 [Porphyridium purpureum]|eukprot:POR8303..scf244_11
MLKATCMRAARESPLQSLVQRQLQRTRFGVRQSADQCVRHASSLWTSAGRAIGQARDAQLLVTTKATGLWLSGSRDMRALGMGLSIRRLSVMRTLPREAWSVPILGGLKGGRAMVLAARAFVLGGGIVGASYTLTPREIWQQNLQALSRSARFWRKVFPIYLHYLLVEKQVAKLSDEEQDAAWNRLHDKYASPVRDLTLSLKGFYIKSAQIVSTRDELVPHQYLKWCKQMQDAVPTELSAAQVRGLVEESLGRKIEDVFDEFEFEPCGAASIGQVHLAKRNGQELVVKVQYPGIEAMFRADMKTIRTFCELAMPQHVPFLSEIEKQFLTEFDYLGEACNLDLVWRNLEKDPKWKAKVKVPRPIMELCSSHVLTMERIPGKRFVDGIRDEFKTLAEMRGMTMEEFEEEQKRHALQSVDVVKRQVSSASRMIMMRDVLINVCVGLYRYTIGMLPKMPELEYVHHTSPINLGSMIETLLQVHGHEIFVDGSFNADAHPGNIILMPDRRLGLIDYGQVKHMSLEERIKYAKLIVALARDDKVEIVRVATEEMGIKTKHMNPDIIYLMMCFQHDRDSDDVMGGRNIHKFMQWMDEVDPVVKMPDSFVMAGRVSILLRGMANAFRISLRTSTYWEPFAEALLAQHPEAAQ